MSTVYPNVLMTSLNATEPRYRHIDGEVSKTQIERVARRLEIAAATQLRIVVTHQPVCVTQANDEDNLLHGRARGGSNSINLIRYGASQRQRYCAVERWDYVASTQSFAKVTTDKLRFDASGE